MSQATLQTTPYHNANLFAGYYLDERVDDLDAWDCDERAQAAFEELQELWEIEGSLLDSYKEDELLDIWIDEVLDTLGFDMMSETTLPNSEGYNDRLLFESGDTRRGAALKNKKGDAGAMYSLASAVLEAKQWDADFSQRFAEQRSYYDASQQIKYYLDKTPEDLRWGILTDGRKWRLYGTKDYATETYYEVDLPEVLESGDLEAFKYFYVFFRPEAFAETAGTSFLDTVWSESETAAQELGSDLQDNVFTALRVLGEGFVETNDLDIDSGDEAALTELKEQSLVLLYRLMFVLYAESRDLIHPEEPEQVAEYEENFSLTQLRSEIHDEVSAGEFGAYSEYSTTMWNRLGNLFSLVDEGNEELGIPPYNGGLFDDEEHAFLADHEVADRYIAEVVYRLGTTESDEGEFVLADYADLDTRHLGSIYEGLLEHEFHVAPEEYAAVAAEGGQVWKPATEVSVADAVETVESGGLYVVNDDGERKATGAYYTPDYVVNYIVEETIDPLLEDIKADLDADGLEPGEPEYFRRFWQDVLGLKILDPAMGSAHFLTSATGYLTEQVMEVVREQEIQSYDEQHLRREIAKECIYGVDINGMAVELGKLSMWLETLAADQPLAFLDHHLKTGNSLVGSDITEVLSDGEEGESGQLTLFEAFDRTRRRALDHVMDRMQELLAIDNETLADIKSMEDIYDDIRADPLYQRLFEMANVHTAEAFGLDVPEDADKRMAEAIEDSEAWAEISEADWFASAQAIADEEDFFHWELEYPEVFFNVDGEIQEESGFDAVVGNPPYAQIPVESVESMYGSGPSDLYAQFILSVPELIRSGGRFSFITPTSWETGPAYSPIREMLLNDGNIDLLVNLPYDIFEDAYVDTTIFVWEDDAEPTVCDVSDKSGTRINPVRALNDLDYTSIPVSHWQELGFIATNETWLRISTSIEDEFDILGDLTESTRGVLITEEALEDEQGDTPILTESFLRYDPVQENTTAAWTKLEERPPNIDWFEGERLLIRRLVSRSDRLLATMTEDMFITKKDTYIFKSNEIDIPILLSIINSKFISWWHFNVELAASKDDFRQITLSALRDLPIPKNIDFKSQEDTQEQFKYGFERYLEGEISVSELCSIVDGSKYTILHEIPEYLINLRKSYKQYNTTLLDHLGSYSDGDTLADVGLTQPPKGSADSILQQTAQQRPNLRVGDCEVVRESDTTVEIRLSARYKPGEARPEEAPRTGTGNARGSDDEDAHETDQWGYTETEFLPALRITDLTETEADLVESFVPVAVDEAGGFAGFRETATKTNSLVDRLRKLTLPAVADVREGLASYRETKARAEELEEKIERTDELIDEIVYELYGLTDDEIEIVEEAVGE